MKVICEWELGIDKKFEASNPNSLKSSFTQSRCLLQKVTKEAELWLNDIGYLISNAFSFKRT